MNHHHACGSRDISMLYDVLFIPVPTHPSPSACSHPTLLSIIAIRMVPQKPQQMPPSYFYHLLFELYSPAVLQSIPKPTAERLGLSEVDKNKASITPPNRPLLPPKGFNIFNSSEGAKLRKDRAASKHNTSSSNSNKQRSEKKDSTATRLTLSSSSGSSSFQGHIDFRFGRITVESIDITPVWSPSSIVVPEGGDNMISKPQLQQQLQLQRQPTIASGLQQISTAQGAQTPQDSQTTYSNVVAGRPAGSDAAPTKATSPVGRRIAAVSAPPKARFVPLPENIEEFGYGVLHLYRDGEETQGIYPMPEVNAAPRGNYNGSANTQASSSSKAEPETNLSKVKPEAGKAEIEKSEENEEALKTVAILAVPSYMTVRDLLGFVGEEARENVSHFRMIRTGKANRYMVLIKFRTKESAREFVRLFDGCLFNSMEVSILPNCTAGIDSIRCRVKAIEIGNNLSLL